MTKLLFNPRLIERHTEQEWKDKYLAITEVMSWEEYSKDLVEVVEFESEFIELSRLS